MTLQEYHTPYSSYYPTGVPDLVTRNWSPSTNQSIWICNVEWFCTFLSKFHRWLKGCLPTVLGHQNESKQIVTPDALQQSNRAFPDRGTFLNNGQFAVLHNILSVVGFLGHSVYETNRPEKQELMFHLQRYMKQTVWKGNGKVIKLNVRSRMLKDSREGTGYGYHYRAAGLCALGVSLPSHSTLEIVKT